MDSSNHPHYVWAFVVVLALSLFAWIYSSNRPDINNFAKGASNNDSHRNDWPLSIHIGEGSCHHPPQEKPNVKSLVANNSKPSH